MTLFSEISLRNILLERFDYRSDEVNDTIKELMALTDEGKSILNYYLETGMLPLCEQNGLSLKIMREQTSPEMKDIALIIIYDGIQRNLKNI